MNAKNILLQTWYLLGQPWCHSEKSGMDILAGDCDPHAGTYLFSTQVIEDDDLDEEQSKELARELAEHIIEAHNKSLDEANKPTNLWLDKLRAERCRVEELRQQLSRSRAEIERLTADLNTKNLLYDAAISRGVERERQNVRLYEEREAARTELSRLRAELEALSDTMAFVLPMAKGYAAVNNVGNNKQIIMEAEAFLAKVAPPPATTGMEGKRG